MNVLLSTRSMLFVPADSDRKLARARESEADALILDLEDAVAPAGKGDARRMCRAFLEGPRGKPIFVRVNSLTDAAFYEDLAAVVGGCPDGIMLPKCTRPDDLRVLDHALSALEVREGQPRGAIAILPIALEVAEAVFSAGTYRGVTSRLCGLMWGVEDIAVDIESAVRDESGSYLPTMELARTLCVYAAAAAGVPAVDAVYSNFKDGDGLARDVASARASGFAVKTAIHPSQVPIINRELTPSADAVRKAVRVVEEFARAPGQGVVAIDGKMHDRPHLRAAQKVLARARGAADGEA